MNIAGKPSGTAGAGIKNGNLAESKALLLGLVAVSPCATLFWSRDPVPGSVK